jgi:2-phosphosulfolactate phosphatase
MFDQSEWDIRFEWGAKGASRLAPVSDAVIVVDVLSFSTSVEIATSRGAIVYPYRWNDLSAYDFARSVAAEVADRNNKNGYGLSPSTLQAVASGTRIVLPSPNGSEACLAAACLAAATAVTIAGCLRNCGAVARSAMMRGKTLAVIAAGERWEDGSLRPCFEDLVGAGAIIKHLRGRLSPEAEAAAAAFDRASSNLPERIAACGSGKQKISRGEQADLSLAAELDKSDCVPILDGGAFINRA